MPSNEKKRAVRAYMDTHGVSYTAALRALDGQQAATPDRVRAHVTVTGSASGTRSQFRWQIVVDDPRTEKPRGGWISLRNDVQAVQAAVDELVAVDGWRRLEIGGRSHQLSYDTIEPTGRRRAARNESPV